MSPTQNPPVSVQLRRARQLVISDPQIMAGDPVFRGTRVPVHTIAAQLARGDSDADILACYPRLTVEMVRHAPIYAAAYRGRPNSRVTSRQMRPNFGTQLPP